MLLTTCKYGPSCQKFLGLLCLVVASCLLLTAKSLAQSDTTYRSERVETGQATSTLIAEGAFVPGQTTWVALDQELAEHWHVYWKNPGDSGLPLVMAWALPEGYVAGDIEYPTPKRIPVGPLVNFGYEGNPVFLIPLSTPDTARPGDSVTISVQASWLICEDICIPEEAGFTLSLPVLAEQQLVSENSAIFEQARARLPRQFDKKVSFASSNDSIFLQVSLGDEYKQNAIFFAEREGVVRSAATQQSAAEEGVLTLVLEPDFDFKPDEKQSLRGVLSFEVANEISRAYTLTAEYDDEVLRAIPAALQTSGTIVEAQRPGADSYTQSSNSSALSLPLLLVMAFLGGILLNIMPCVFPILFIKASSLMSSAGEDQRTIRAHGWLYTAGVVVTFAAMGAFLLALRAQGEQLGWGFHLQSPIVVVLSAYTLFLVGLNLAGVFHVGTSLQGVGQGLTAKRGGVGAFFTGMLAVVVAAPCIGPLLSAPMGAAVFLPPLWGMMIFILMALGLAMPYLLVSLVPSLGTRLPKPGAWMEVFKQFLSFPVFAAAAYFLWVLAAQTGSSGLAIGFIGMLLLALAAWIFERTKQGKWQLAGGLIAILIVAGVLMPLPTLKPVSVVASEKSGGKHGAIASEVFNKDRIAELNALGQDVFVDFTAAWCVTCQFNKLTVFSSNTLAQRFVDADTVFMVADWTVRDPYITETLEGFGRSGVPLYVIYRADGEAEILPLPLTERAVKSALSAPV